ncbi:MAG: hypothetical protein OXR68_02365 [Alphaproteobacteria bacterium]|nr:hypothetical protein [Alphaproteobacteria bacterium]MDD9919453.1 hypothetical protein [Alphaproteobacteria bacterium]
MGFWDMDKPSHTPEGESEKQRVLQHPLYKNLTELAKNAGEVQIQVNWCPMSRGNFYAGVSIRVEPGKLEGNLWTPDRKNAIASYVQDGESAETALQQLIDELDGTAAKRRAILKEEEIAQKTQLAEQIEAGRQAKLKADATAGKLIAVGPVWFDGEKSTLQNIPAELDTTITTCEGKKRYAVRLLGEKLRLCPAGDLPDTGHALCIVSVPKRSKKTVWGSAQKVCEMQHKVLFLAEEGDTMSYSAQWKSNSGKTTYERSRTFVWERSSMAEQMEEDEAAVLSTESKPTAPEDSPFSALLALKKT